MEGEMNELKLRSRVFVSDLIQLGDIVLTTTPEPMSKTIRKAIGADISHAMICVGGGADTILTQSAVLR